MTLGERIQALRRDRGMSQEDLAEALGVSRQAVSKWEKGLSYPDTRNLLALAELFGVSADELALLRRQEAPGEAPPPAEPEPAEAGPSAPRRRFSRWVPVAAVALAALAVVLIPVTVHLALRRMETGPVENVPSDVAEADGQGGEEAEGQDGAEAGGGASGLAERPGLERTGEFALVWEEAEGYAYLAIGRQTEYFPFGTTLTPTEPETVSHVDTYGDLHEVDCGDLKLRYGRWEEESGPVEAVWQMTTMVPGYETARGIQTGSREAELLSAYGDELLYHLKEDSYTLVPHEYYYIYAYPGGGSEIAFFIQKGEVAALRIRALFDEAFEGADNLYSFPVVDGQPDFSARKEPEKEEIDETRAVYIALHALENQTNLSAEEIYRCRQDIYSNLQYMSWGEYGRLGEAGKSNETKFALLNWLCGQDTLSESEIYGLQAGGCLRTDLDGAYAESYGLALGKAFSLYPVEFVRILADKDFTGEERQMVVASTVYGAGWMEETFRQAVQELKEATMFTEEQEQQRQAFLENFREVYPDDVSQTAGGEASVWDGSPLLLEKFQKNCKIHLTNRVFFGIVIRACSSRRDMAA